MKAAYIPKWGLLLATLINLLPATVVANRAPLLLNSQLPLETSGRDIVDAQGEVVKLACVNWYGAHMETFTVNGLHKRTLQEIVDHIAATGFNCIRMPFALDLTFKPDYVVPTVALTANPEMIGKTGLEIFHLTMKALTDASIVVFLNNHNSVAAWCCNIDSEDGLWSNSAYDAEQWIESLVYLADYYKDDKHVIGMDLRNEIHDVKQADRYITWGESEDIDNDWKYATEVASAAIYDVNPDWLIIVSGLCFSFDLRKMVDDLPDLKQVNKLVWTTHYYSFSRWWQKMENQVLIRHLDMTWIDLQGVTIKWIIGSSFALFILTFALSARVKFNKLPAFNFYPKEPKVTVAAITFSLTIYCVFLIVGLDIGSQAVREGYDKGGCATMAIEADIMDVGRKCAIALAVISSLIHVVFQYMIQTGKSFRRDDHDIKFDDYNSSKEVEMQRLSNEGLEKDGRRSSNSSDGGNGANVQVANKQCMFCDFLVFTFIHNVFIILILILAVAIFINHMANKTETYDMFHDELYGKWVLGNHNAPVLVGEFGTGSDGVYSGETDYWYAMTRFLKEYDLNYAYWPWNGERWNNSTLSFQNEGYGLVDTDWETIRRPKIVSDLISLNDEL
ncbi:hypothetical protein TL16_g08221 [Triparma laevis f. inornata]|uniref:Glycoside hydrolase family 5 domain-containing protein n=2 Tax=Triparma laevis TaxID=1534972 RepID=A0A9W7C8B5_9STRA|nr:hypothetical protein TL16_g08221 [Triparma laevis f. inornata]GMI01035.1 hypothetical protein TrLO_g479 [Triparma laevis f. longispina]